MQIYLGNKAEKIPEIRTDLETVTKLRQMRKTRIAGRFIRGPIPYWWVAEALKVYPSAGNYILSLWYLDGLKYGNHSTSVGTVERDFHVGQKTKQRILKALEAAGLISVERKPGSKPRVTILTERC